MERVTGTYALNKRWPWIISQQADGLRLKTDKETRLLPLTETTFYPEDDVENELHFAEENAGKFQQMIIKSPLASFTLPRIQEEGQ